MSLKRLSLAALMLALLSSFVLLAFALEVPTRPAGRITDLTSTLTPQQISDLEAKLSAFERETTNQIAVLLIPTLAGDSLEEYSIRLAEKWKIGQTGKDNGVILLIVKNDRKLRIEVGYGLEGALPDALAKTIINQELTPLFRQGNFYGGIARGLSAIMQATKGEYKREQRPRPFWTSQGFIILVAVLLLIIFSQVFGNTFRSSSRRRGYSHYSGGWPGSFGGGGDSGFSGGGGSFGGGGASGGW